MSSLRAFFGNPQTRWSRRSTGPARARGRIAVSLVVAAAVAVAASACGSDSSSDSPESLRDTAKDAYIFAYPVVMNYRTMYRQALSGGGEFGKWLHLGLATPADTDIVTPNNDTPYSYAWVDLRAEPWVLTLPPVEPNRYYTSQWDDLWGFVLDNPGSVQDGNNGITVMLAAPEWKGETPAGVSRVIRGESDILGTLTRTQVLGTDDGLSQVQRIQQEYQLRPLSAYTNTPAPAAAPAVQWPAWQDGADKTAQFWDYLAFMLPFITPNPVDQPMYDKLAKLGIERGKPWNPATLDASVRDALSGGVTDGQAELAGAGNVDSAKLFADRAALGTDYRDRALGVFAGIFGNVADQAIYFPLGADATGQPLDGSKGSYSITFPAGQTPPVQYFWSFTMYELPQRQLVANPIDRYSLGSATPGLQSNPDGSLTVRFSAQSPGDAAASNWLPAPNGPFWVVLRTYGPDQRILSKSWQPPTITKAG
ncbi:DUF1214 domain-containing protein [Nocardia sp. NPDC051832]|uniref:DUF1254 domain-containing protein n=1 Tax=Nocardia sp. NPDC051832 TaxID=3155673 RepID=UPI00342FEF8F